MLKIIFSFFKKNKKKVLRPNHLFKELLSEEFIQDLIKHGDFIDGRSGGLILGNSHLNGGVIFLYQFPEGFRVFGEVEGYEYIINRDSSEIHRNEIRNINNHDRDYHNTFIEYKKPKKIKIIDARMKNNRYKYLLLDSRGGFAIINRHSTKLYLERIDLINKSGREI